MHVPQRLPRERDDRADDQQRHEPRRVAEEPDGAGLPHGRDVGRCLVRHGRGGGETLRMN